MRSAFALRIFSGRIILNFAFVALCGALQTHFHRRGRKGKVAFAAPLSAKARRCGKVFGQIARFTGALAPPREPTSPGRGKMSPQVTKRGICRAATEGLLMEKRKKRYCDSADWRSASFFVLRLLL